MTLFQHPPAAPAIQLRPYQAEAVEALFAWFEEHTTNPLIVAPTGAGKSVILTAFVREVLRQYPSERILVVTHVRELIQQNHDAMLRVWPEAPVGIWSAGLKRRDKRAQVLFCGIQTVYAKAAAIEWADLILVDEAHLIPRDGMGMYRQFLNDLLAINSKVKVIGLTATPYRTDTGRLDRGPDALFGGIAYDCDIVSLIEQGYLSRITNRGTAAAIDTRGVHRRGGEFIPAELEAAALTGDLVPRAVDEIVARAGDRKSWLLFCCGVDHATQVRDELRRRGIESECIFGKTPKGERDAIIERFRAGKLRTITNMNVLTTGFDAPNIDLIALLRPTCSPGLYCLDSETEILTSRGWLGMGDVVVGDCALAMDTRDGSGRWSGVKATIRRPMTADESWVEYDAPRANFRVTDKHRILFRLDNEDKWSIGEAAEVAKRRDGFYMPTAVSMDQVGVPLTDAELYLIGILMTDGTFNAFQATIFQSERYPKVCERIEWALRTTGIAYRKTLTTAPSAFKENYKRWRYSISAGDPRCGREGKGFRYLMPWLDKNLAPAMMSLSSHQFSVLLDAMWDGDGTKKENVGYTPRSKQLCTSRRRVADRMQALGVMHGHTVHLRWEHKGRKNPIALLTFTPKEWRSIGGVGNRPQVTTAPATDEEVWCVETEHGTIVTRRRGKVTVMGNCQMVGRGLRIAPGKADCLVLDFGGNVVRHGPIDHIDPAEEGAYDTEGVAPAKQCPSCMLLVPISVRDCPECGFEFAVLEPEKDPHDAKPIEDVPIIRGSATIERWDVLRVTTAEHHKPDKPVSMRVEYDCGFNRYVREWICFEHDGFARRKAEQWWRARGGQEPVPETVDQARVRIDFDELRPVLGITVDVRGEYPKLLGVRLGEKEAGLNEEIGAHLGGPRPTDIDLNEIPF